MWYSWNKYACNRNSHSGLKHLSVDLENFWCEGICVWHRDSQTNQIWELSVLNGAPQACDFKAHTLYELAPLLQISLETKPKHQSVIIWGRSGRVSTETAIHWGIQLCSGAMSSETGVKPVWRQQGIACREMPFAPQASWVLQPGLWFRVWFSFKHGKNDVQDVFLNRACLFCIPLAESLSV